MRQQFLSGRGIGRIKSLPKDVIFDVDGTLVNLNVNWVEVKSSLRDTFGFEFTPLYLVLGSLPIRDRLHAIDIIRLYERRAFPLWEINSRLTEWIKGNSQKYQIHLLSNNTSDTISRLLDSNSLRDHVKVAVSIDDAESPKPTDAGLHLLLSRANADSTETLLLGNGDDDRIVAQNNNLSYIIGDWFASNVYCYLKYALEQ